MNPQPRVTVRDRAPNCVGSALRTIIFQRQPMVRDADPTLIARLFRGRRPMGSQGFRM
jgi:hypothetical protein